MVCDKIGDEALQADKLDVLYGEADVAARARLDAHLLACAACREEMTGLRGLRRDLRAWQVSAPRPAFTPRGVVVPRWLAAAAVLLVGFAAALGATGYVSVRRALAAQEARAAETDLRHRETIRALEASLERPRAAGPDATALLAGLDARIDEKLRASEARQSERLDLRLADWQDRAEAQRRVDMARVAAGLSYLDGRNGQQLARTNELVGYMLEASQKR